MKWFIRILVVLAVLIAGLRWFGYSKIDDLLKLGIEKAGTEALQAPVTIQKLKISMFSGACRVALTCNHITCFSHIELPSAT